MAPLETSPSSMVLGGFEISRAEWGCLSGLMIFLSSVCSFVSWALHSGAVGCPFTHLLPCASLRCRLLVVQTTQENLPPIQTSEGCICFEQCGNIASGASVVFWHQGCYLNLYFSLGIKRDKVAAKVTTGIPAIHCICVTKIRCFILLTEKPNSKIF